jgi:hypothetical protein
VIAGDSIARVKMAPSVREERGRGDGGRGYLRQVADIFSPFVALTSYYADGGKGVRIPVNVAVEVAQNEVIRIVCDHDKRRWDGQGGSQEGGKNGART